MRRNLPNASAVFLFCCLTFMTSGCYNMNGYVMNASGHGYYEQGNYAMAAREFQSALQSNPYNPDYMANLAKTRQKMGDPNSAEQLFRQALSTDPSHQPSYHGLAELMLANGRTDEASRLLTTWSATQPYVAESHVELAWLQRELGQNHAAAGTLQRALQVNPSHSTALAHLGQYYQETGQPDQAIAMYQRSLQSDWGQPEVHSQIAVAAQQAGPNHPMGEMAMSRGVHPHSLARQPEVFGNPNGPMMAYPNSVGSGNNFAAAPPMIPSTMMGQQNFPPQPQLATANHPIMNGPTAGGFDPMSIPLAGGVPSGLGSPNTPVTFSPPMTSVPAGVSSSPASPSPAPDPAFAEGDSGIPATTISQSMTVAEIPEIEAF